MTYKIILAESEREVNGPFEIFPEAYGTVDRTDYVAMLKLAHDLSQDYDGTYVVYDK